MTWKRCPLKVICSPSSSRVPRMQMNLSGGISLVQLSMQECQEWWQAQVSAESRSRFLSSQRITPLLYVAYARDYRLKEPRSWQIWVKYFMSNICLHRSQTYQNRPCRHHIIVLRHLSSALRGKSLFFHPVEEKYVANLLDWRQNFPPQVPVTFCCFYSFASCFHLPRYVPDLLGHESSSSWLYE